MTRPELTLVGDGIEHPGNARAMQAAAAMFGRACRFRDRSGLATAMPGGGLHALQPPIWLSRDDLARDYTPVIALDNLPGAMSVYGFRLAVGGHAALVAGNERRGIAADIQSIAAQRLVIPLASHRLNTLNVAAASAVALYYLGRGGGASQRLAPHPAARRPEILLAGPTDHIELGSSIRSAGAFGWQRLLIDDCHGIWFGHDRVRRAEGNAAARRHRNPIRLLPVRRDPPPPFDRVVLATIRRDGIPLHRANLARGGRQLIVIADESSDDRADEPWHATGRPVTTVRLDVAPSAFPYHFRLIASIVLAEIARQVGTPAPSPRGRPSRRPPVYDRALELEQVEGGEVIYLDELVEY